MKIDINNKAWIISLLIINVEGVCASTNALHTHMNINWWGIGEKYNSTPALGWYILTFLMFFSIVIYYGYNIFVKILEPLTLESTRCTDMDSHSHASRM